MKYAIMSDVHANPAALETALFDARRRKCQRFIMLGDTTGYGYDPVGALNLVKQNFDVVLIGNHDSACVGKEPPLQMMMNPNYDLDLSARDLLSADSRAYLASREYLFAEDSFACVHADFLTPQAWRYIMTEVDATINFSSRREKLFFCGHTHHAAVWEQNAKGSVKEHFEKRLSKPAIAAESISFKVNNNSRYIVNVGSVGYPRNDLCSTYCIYDSDLQRITLRRLPFDFKTYIEDMETSGVGLPPWLVAILRAALAL